MSSTERSRRLSALVVTLAVAAGWATTLGTAAGSPPGPPSSSQAATARTVTLITGDRVRVETLSGGKQGVSVQPGPGRARVSFAYRSQGDEVSVVPSDALRLVNAGVLDKRLFDVTGLVRAGYDDTSRPDLPLIVAYGNRTLAAATRTALARSAVRGPALSSLDGEALRARKRQAGGFWASVTRPQTGKGSRSLGPGVAHVWLDGPVRASLDESVPQVGAPIARQAGYTGKDVAVAVLDTGIDAAHPDLADAVTAAQDFTGNAAGPRDGHGHGTHVASIITGSGAASGGRYAGVAPDTKLLVGKVLDDEGSGTEAQAIAGMEWAVAQHARVVNMSLGGDRPSDGTDPMSQAVNELSGSSGALFAVAAGNSGSPGSVSSPGAADAALTVGAVDKQDKLAYFSSRGPRAGDRAIKPEITAPGVDIAAARAAGTTRGTPVDERYTRLGGTSMATPHVAGGAAILAQQHPDWTAGQLKAALISSTRPDPARSVFDQGTGRLDVGRAVTQLAYAGPGAVSANLRWPHTDVVTRTVTYHNDGTTPLDLNLALHLTGGGGTAASLVTPSLEHLTVPAHGSAGLTLTINPTGAAPGDYQGLLTATSADGATRVGTAVAVHVEPEQYDLNIDIIDRAGQHLPPARVGLVNLDTGVSMQLRTSGGKLVARVPKGRYTLDSLIYTYNGDTEESMTVATRPEMTVDRDLSLKLDARPGRPVTVRVDSRSARPAFRWLGVSQKIAGGEFELRGYTEHPAVDQYAVPTAAVTSRPYTFLEISTLTEPATKGAIPRSYNLLFPVDGRIPDAPSFRVRDRDLTVVHARYHAQGTATTGARGNLAALDDYGRASGGFYDVALPGRRSELFTPGPRARWDQYLSTGAGTENASATRRFQTGREQAQDWNKAAIGPQTIAGRCEDFLEAYLYPFDTSVTDHHTGSDPETMTGSLTLERDGERIGSSHDPTHAAFDGLPARKATYTLRLGARRDIPSSGLATRVNAAWTFTSAQPSDCTSTLLPLLNLRIGGDFDLLDRAPAHRPFPLRLHLERGDQPTANGPTPTLDASFDDGTTWAALPVSQNGDGFRAVVPATTPGSGTGYVSLRATAHDSGGNRLEQTTIRAYRLAP